MKLSAKQGLGFMLMRFILCCLMVLVAFRAVLAETGTAGEGGKTADKVAFSPDMSGGDAPVPDLFTGAVSYRIPIEVPPGRNGMEPNLALVYQSGNGNGWVGVGWELEVGAVERATRDGIDYAGDSYVLRRGGSRLELVSIGGGEYRAKVEAEFFRIQRVLREGSGGSQWLWIATNKNGIRFYYGQTLASRQYDPDDQTKEFKWCLDKVEDPNGNKILFYYSHDSGQIYLSHIDYGAAKIIFDMESSGDGTKMYNTNFSVMTSTRLKSISIFSNNKLDKWINLDYLTSQNTLRSLLYSIQQYGSDVQVDIHGNIINTTSSLPPIKIYTSGLINGFEEQTWATSASNWGEAGYTWSGDYDGDGKSDLATALGGTIWVKRSMGDHFEEESWATAASHWGDPGYTWGGDFDGDGKRDLATASGGNIWVKRSMGDHFVEELWAASASNWGGPGYTWSADFDGDGKSDIYTSAKRYDNAMGLLPDRLRNGTDRRCCIPNCISKCLH